MASTSATASRSINRIIGAVFGGVYILVGILGFTVTGGRTITDTMGGKLLGLFMVNPLHNLVHIAIGLLLAGAAWTGTRAAKAVNTTVGAVYLVVGVIGLFVLGSSDNILALNSADNGLHFASALLLLGVGIAADRTAGGRIGTTPAQLPT
jgi:hypothetical protein